MANYSTLKAAVADVVKTNGSQAITGANLQTVLLSIINSIGGGGYIFNGVATPSTDAGTPDQNVFYIGGSGTYANFGTSVIVPPTNIAVFKYNGSWTCEQVMVENGGVFDISAFKVIGGTLATYADLAAALGTGGANVPEGIRKGGMSIKFVQSSDNKYVQWKLTAQSFTTDVTQWEKQGAEVTIEDVVRLNEWQPNTNYAVGNQRQTGTPIKYYRCITAHTSGSSFDATEQSNWAEITDFISDGASIQKVNIGNSETPIYQSCLKITGIGTSGTLAPNIGDVMYNDITRVLRIRVSLSSSPAFKTLPFYDGAIYSYNSLLYTWNGSDLVPVVSVNNNKVVIAGQPTNIANYFVNVNDINNRSTAYSGNSYARNSVPEALRIKGLTITYLVPSGWWVETYIGSDTTTENWENLNNWVRYSKVSINTVEPVKDSWVANKKYYVGGQVKQSDKYYRCITTHTSGSSFDSTEEANWAEIADFIDGYNHIQSININNAETPIYLNCIKLKGIDSTLDVGEVTYISTTHLLRIKLNAVGLYGTLPYRDGAIYSIGNDLYIWSGSNLVSCTTKYIVNINNYINYENPLSGGKTYARESVPTSLRMRGLVITYLLNAGWQIEMFIGNDTTGTNWTSSSNWRSLSSVSVTSNYNIKDWEANTSYVVGNQRQNNGHYYRCSTAHISGSSFDVTEQANWTEITDFIDNAGTTRQSVVIDEIGIPIYQNYIKLFSIQGTSSEMQVGDIAYIPAIHLLRLKYNKSSYKTVPYYDGAIYEYDGAFYIWNGSDLVPTKPNIDYNTFPIDFGQSGIPNGWLAIGYDTQGAKTSYCIGIGNNVLHNNTGIKNITVGLDNMENCTGHDNTSMGYHASFRNTSGSGNAAFGSEAQDDNTAGTENTAVGFCALQRNNTGQHNVAIGSNALRGGGEDVHYDPENLKDFSRNVAIGAYTMEEAESGSEGCIAIGHHTLTPNSDSEEPRAYKHCIAIGDYVSCREDNMAVFGDNYTYKTVIRGNEIIFTTSAGVSKKLVFNQDGTVTWTSL